MDKTDPPASWGVFKPVGHIVIAFRGEAQVQADRVAALARSLQAVAAQRYGSFLIEELIESTPGRNQVFESPDRGLDLAEPGVARG